MAGKGLFTISLLFAVIGNLEDGGFGAEYIAKRVADAYIPGAFGDGMKKLQTRR